MASDRMSAALSILIACNFSKMFLRARRALEFSHGLGHSLRIGGRRKSLRVRSCPKATPRQTLGFCREGSRGRDAVANEYKFKRLKWPSRPSTSKKAGRCKRESEAPRAGETRRGPRRPRSTEVVGSPETTAPCVRHAMPDFYLGKTPSGSHAHGIRLLWRKTAVGNNDRAFSQSAFGRVHGAGF